MNEPVIFLDRDGVINQYPGHGNYLTSWKEFKFIPGSIEGIRKLTEAGFKIFVISNQAGVAKGLYRQQDLDEIDKNMSKAIVKAKGKLAGIYYCTHFPDEGCNCRKPKTGLLQKALGRNSALGEKVFFIGDSFIDMATARNFSAKSILVLSGREKIADRANWEFEPDYVFDNLLLAAHYLTSGHA